MGGGGVLRTPHPGALPPGKRPSCYCVGGWANHRARLDYSEKSRPHRDSSPVQLSQQRVAIPATLLGPQVTWYVMKLGIFIIFIFCPVFRRNFFDMSY
jgi:hypothetical protein